MLIYHEVAVEYHINETETGPSESLPVFLRGILFFYLFVTVNKFALISQFKYFGGCVLFHC